MSSFALDQTVECCKLHCDYCWVGEIEELVVKSVADSVVDVDADIEEVGGAHSEEKDDDQLEEVEGIHVEVQQCAFQVHLVNIDGVTARGLLLLFQLVHQCHNS